jgi:ATP-dependent Clp protease adapter protein ClpS
MPLIEEETKVTDGVDSIYGHKVVLYNDDVNPFDHVEECLIKICFKSEQQSKEIAFEAHTKGKAVCYEGSLEVCETVLELMSEQNLTVSLE